MKPHATFILVFLLAHIEVNSAEEHYDPLTSKVMQSSTDEVTLVPEAAPCLLRSQGDVEALYGTDVATEVLIEIDKQTASALDIGPLGSPIVAGIAYDPALNILYGADTLTGNLVTIDICDGSTMLIGNTGINLPHGLAFDSSTSTLYAADSKSVSDLYEIDTADGSAILVGPIGFPDIGALAFDPTTGTLYGAHASFDSTGFLVTIDPTTGQGTFVADTHRINGLAFDQQGMLYASENGLSSGVNSSLYLIDKSTGAFNLIGDIGRDNVLGLSFGTACLLFGDGFESGDTSAWSTTVP